MTLDSLNGRLALRPKEAAQALGLSERTLRAILPRLPHLRVGNSVLIPIDALRDWLRQEARSGTDGVDAAVKAALRAVEVD